MQCLSNPLISFNNGTTHDREVWQLDKDATCMTFVSQVYPIILYYAVTRRQPSSLGRTHTLDNVSRFIVCDYGSGVRYICTFSGWTVVV